MGYIDSHTGRYVPNTYLDPHRDHRNHRDHRDHRDNRHYYGGISLNQILLIFIGLLVFFGTIIVISNK